MSASNPLQGKWKVECQVRADDGRWETFRKFKTYSGECVWSFRTESSFSYTDPDEWVHRGELTEYFGRESVVAEYGYLENAGRLYIERRDKNGIDCIRLHYKDIFQVEKTDANQFILCELRSDDDEPDDHICRLILTRVC